MRFFYFVFWSCILLTIGNVHANGLQNSNIKNLNDNGCVNNCYRNKEIVSSDYKDQTLNILYVGDSNSAGLGKTNRGGKFGDYIYDFLKYYPATCKANRLPQLGNEIDFHAVPGSSFHSWAGLPKLLGQENKSHSICKKHEKTLLRNRLQKKKMECPKGQNSIIQNYIDKQLDVFVFQFLGNSVYVPEHQLALHVKGFLDGWPADKPCVYISSMPYLDPDGTRQNKNFIRQITQFSIQYILNELRLRAGGKRCSVVENMSTDTLNDFAKKKENYLDDGVHLSDAGAKNFFTRVRKQICQRELL